MFTTEDMLVALTSTTLIVVDTVCLTGISGEGVEQGNTGLGMIVVGQLAHVEEEDSMIHTSMLV